MSNISLNMFTTIKQSFNIYKRAHLRYSRWLVAQMCQINPRHPSSVKEGSFPDRVFQEHKTRSAYIIGMQICLGMDEGETSRCDNSIFKEALAELEKKFRFFGSRSRAALADLYWITRFEQPETIKEEKALLRSSVDVDQGSSIMDSAKTDDEAVLRLQIAFLKSRGLNHGD